MVKRAVSKPSSLSPVDPHAPEKEVKVREGDPEANPSRLPVDPSSDEPSPSKAKRRKKHTSKYKDEFQQVSNPKFVDVYRIPDMGYGGDVYYKSDFIPSFEANAWYDILLALDTWCMPLDLFPVLADALTDQPTLKLYGREFSQSRLIAAYSTEPNMTLAYSGSEISMNYPYPEVLTRMQERLEEELGVKFNHCMLNRYDDGSVMIGKHSDNLNNLVIASVSLGAERTFILSPRLPSKSASKGKQVAPELEKELERRKNIRMTLANGSLLVMQGRTQEFWKHEIPREASVKKGRISLTFRQLV